MALTHSLILMASTNFLGYTCYGEKLPMAWGVPQQIARPEKSIPSQYARETKHITLRDLESYLIPDG